MHEWLGKMNQRGITLEQAQPSHQGSRRIWGSEGGNKQIVCSFENISGKYVSCMFVGVIYGKENIICCLPFIHMYACEYMCVLERDRENICQCVSV